MRVEGVKECRTGQVQASMTNTWSLNYWRQLPPIFRPEDRARERGVRRHKIPLIPLTEIGAGLVDR